MESLYDHPEYYDILFGWGRDAEAASYDAIFSAYNVDRAGPLIELGTGTGQIAGRLAQFGWDVVALDWSPAMLAYATEAAAARGVVIRTQRADMRTFHSPVPYWGALCPLGTFAMLPDDASALAHLRVTAAALERGAPYVLDLTLSRQAGEPAHPSDAWTMQRGGIEVEAGVGGVQVTDPTRDGPLALSWGPPLRDFDAETFKALIEESNRFDIVGHHPDIGPIDDGDVSAFDPVRRGGLPDGRGLIALRRRP